MPALSLGCAAKADCGTRGARASVKRQVTRDDKQLVTLAETVLQTAAVDEPPLSLACEAPSIVVFARTASPNPLTHPGR